MTFSARAAADAPASAWLDVAGTGAANVARMAASLAILMITTRALGPDGRGVFAAASAWVLLFGSFASLSVGPVVVNVSAGRPRDEWLPEVAGSALTITAIVTLGAWTIAGALYVATAGAAFAMLSPSVLAVAMLTIPFFIADDIGRYILYAIDGLRRYNTAQVLGACAGPVLAAIALIRLQWGVRGALLAIGASYAVTAIAGWSHVLNCAPYIRAAWSTSRRLVGDGLKLHLNAIGNYLFTHASVIILSYYRAPSDVAFYQLATQMFNLSLVIPTAFGSVAYAMVARRGADAAWPQQRRLLLQAVGVVCVAAATGYVVAPLAIRTIAGPAFLPAVPLFRWIAPSLVGAAMSSVMASQWVGRGLLWQVSLLTLAVGVISLACDFTFIPRLGASGAVISTVVTYGISVVGNGAMAAVVEWRVRR